MANADTGGYYSASSSSRFVGRSKPAARPDAAATPQAHSVVRAGAPGRNDDSKDRPALNAAPKKLDAMDSRKADVVKLRMLFELTIPEVSEALGLGHATVERDWRFARAWLAPELAEQVRIELENG